MSDAAACCSRIGPARAEVYVNARLASSPKATDIFAFSEATRTIRLGERSASASDAETLNLFRRSETSQGEELILCRQRILRFLTPNPNSAEGVLWQEGSAKEKELFASALLAVRQLS